MSRQREHCKFQDVGILMLSERRVALNWALDKVAIIDDRRNIGEMWASASIGLPKIICRAAKIRKFHSTARRKCEKSCQWWRKAARFNSAQVRWHHWLLQALQDHTKHTKCRATKVFTTFFTHDIFREAVHLILSIQLIPSSKSLSEMSEFSLWVTSKWRFFCRLIVKNLMKVYKHTHTHLCFGKIF
jgi:hypothetical protein